MALRREWVPAALSLLVYTIITAIIGRDVLAHLGSTIANDAGDPLLTAAILKWNATHLPLTDAWYQFPIFYPTRDTLTFSEHLLGLSVIASPLYWLIGDIVITYNLVLLLTFPLCGIAMYALVVRLTGSEAGAFIAGLAFAFAPYRISQLPHIQMLATFWAPLALLGLHVYLQSGRRRWLALYGAGWALQGAANGYALVMFSILVGLWVLWFVVMSGKWHALLMIGLASLAAFVPLAPVLYTYATVHNYYGFVRDYWEIRTFSADIAALLCAPSSLTFWAWLRVKCGPEGELFPGAALMLLSVLGIIGIAVRTWRSTSVQSGRVVTYARRFLLFVASLYAVVIAVLLLWGPFMFSIGPLRVQASTYRKPVQVIVLTLVLALVLSPGARSVARQSRLIGFYVLAGVAMWALALGPITSVMGDPGIPGPYHLLMSLPGVDSLRVPARFWLMSTLCLSVIAGLVVAEFTRGRSRRATFIAVIVVCISVLSDGWVDRIPAVSLPPPVPGAAAMAGATVLEVPPGAVFRDIQAVFRAVNGGWKTVNGYSGWNPTYYHTLVGAGRDEADTMLTPFQQFGDLHVLVDGDAPRLRELIERQPGVARVASEGSLTTYRLPRRQTITLARAAGERWRPRELRSACATALLLNAIDQDEISMWQCPLRDERRALTADLGEVRTVGSVVHSLGIYSWLVPSALDVETSEDGASWNTAWSGTVRDRTIVAAMEDPRRLRIVVAFPPRPARFVRLRETSGGNDVPWVLAELEVWSSSTESR